MVMYCVPDAAFAARLKETLALLPGEVYAVEVLVMTALLLEEEDTDKVAVPAIPLTNAVWEEGALVEVTDVDGQVPALR